MIYKTNRFSMISESFSQEEQTINGKTKGQLEITKSKALDGKKPKTRKLLIKYKKGE